MPSESPRLLRLRDVCSQTSLSRTSVYALIRRGSFPAPIRIQGTRVSAWDAQAIDHWVHEQLNRAQSAD